MRGVHRCLLANVSCNPCRVPCDLLVYQCQRSVGGGGLCRLCGRVDESGICVLLLPGQPLALVGSSSHSQTVTFGGFSPLVTWEFQLNGVSGWIDGAYPGILHRCYS